MHISKICCYFAPAFEEKTSRNAGKKVLRKVFWKKFPKYLVVSKTCFIFAPAFASKTADSEKGSQKKFLKKVSKIFGSFKNSSYLCNRFSLLKGWFAKKVLEKNFWKKLSKNLVVSKIVLTFAPLSRLKKKRLKVNWKWFFDLLVFILREKV